MKVTQLCLTLCNPMDYTVHGIHQARILEWVAFPFSTGSSKPRDQTQVSRIASGFLTSWATIAMIVTSRKLFFFFFSFMIYHIFGQKVTHSYLQFPLLVMFVFVVVPRQGQGFTVSQQPEEPGFFQTPTLICWVVFQQIRSFCWLSTSQFRQKEPLTTLHLC